MESAASAIPPCGDIEDSKENVDSPFPGNQITDLSKAHGTPHPPSSQQEDQDQLQHQLVEQQHLLEGGERRQEEERFLDEADRDKERYTKELQQYQKTEAFRSYSRKSQNRQKGRQQRQEASRTMPNDPDKESVLKERSVFEIPIFTEEFLNHSKARETELRQLRKSNMDHEERNAALQKHVESMRSAVQRLEAELQQEQERNTLLQQHLQSVRQTLAHCLQAVPIPGSTETPTLETIDSYMSRLQSAVLTHPKESEALISGVREVLSQLEG
ncbi:high mobility group protein 20A isoform 2-T2 [Mantella aurantiaca]